MVVVAVALAAVLFELGGVAGAEEAVEHLARIDFLRDGRRIGAPRDVGGVSAAITGVAVSSLGAALAADFQGREPRVPPELLRGKLVDRNAEVDVRAGGLARLGSRKERRGGTGMVAGAVAVGAGFVGGEAGEDGQRILERIERLEGGGQLAKGAVGARTPIRHVDAVRDEEEAHAQRRLLLGDGGARGARQHGVEQRQRHGGPDSPQYRSTR